MPPKGWRKEASVEVQEIEPEVFSEAYVDIEDVGQPPTAVHSSEVFVAQHEGRTVRDVEQSTSEDGSPVATTHIRPGTLIMYKPSEEHGYVPKTVSATAIRLLLRQGWYENCPDCGGQHIDRSGQVSTSPNLCAGREPLRVRVCRVCRKRIYDNVRFAEDVEDEDDDPNIINDGTYDLTTPEKRTEVLLNLHYWLRHARQAQMMGIPPLPQALREMVEEAKPV